MTELDEAKLRHPSTGSLQQIIATSGVRAFNTGYEHGVLSERERLLKELEELTNAFNSGLPSSAWIRDLYRFVRYQRVIENDNELTEEEYDAKI